MVQQETILETTDRLLSNSQQLAKSEKVVEGGNRRNMDSLWTSGLSSSLLFSVGEARLDEQAEREAQRIVARHLEREKHLPTATGVSQMVDFQRALQMRSKVISTIETLMRG